MQSKPSSILLVAIAFCNRRWSALVYVYRNSFGPIFVLLIILEYIYSCHNYINDSRAADTRSTRLNECPRTPPTSFVSPAFDFTSSYTYTCVVATAQLCQI
jgi:hypothetical protein